MRLALCVLAFIVAAALAGASACTAQQTATVDQYDCTATCPLRDGGSAQTTFSLVNCGLNADNACAATRLHLADAGCAQDGPCNCAVTSDVQGSCAP